MNRSLRKTFLIVLLTVIYLPAAFSQALYKVPIEEKIQGSSLIIEGKVIEQNSFWNPGHSMIYTSNKIQVYKAFKGSGTPAFIEVLTQGGTVGMDQIEASDLLELAKGEIGVFFCHPNSINLKNPLTGNVLLDVYSSAQGFFRYDINKKIADAPFVKYSNIVTELYPELQSKIGHSYQTVYSGFQLSATPTTPPTTLALAITGFSPTTVASGATLNPATNLLTIDGTDFGTASGSAAILFDDANNGTGGTAWTVLYNDPLVVSWTNTQIQVRVPSRVGTGTFQVMDNVGNVTTSPGILNVSYSILTATFTNAGSTVTKESNLMSDNGIGGYSVTYSTNTAGGGVDLDASPVKATFQRALNTWKEISGFNVIESGTTLVQAQDPDGFNLIMFDNTNSTNLPLASGVLAVCYSYNSMCTPITANEVQKTEFDIVIRNAGVSTGSTAFNTSECFQTTAQIDMETVLLHELGHALNLGHINDDYQGSFLPNINPAKLMNFSVVNGVDRRSPDWSAYQGSIYTINPQGNIYGSCGLAAGEMIPLITTTESKDECPVSFPAGATASNTLVPFDLVHATSNKFGDPQYTAINCAGTGTAITNTAFYAVRTNATGGTMTLTVSGYATSPASQQACGGAGVELALYATSSCPVGQAFPAPVACRTFNADGALTNFTGLAANTNYLIVVDGISNTKATFNLLINGSAIPLKLAYFNGVAATGYNYISWKAESIISVDKIALETSTDGINFTQVHSRNVPANASSLEDSYKDFSIASVKYYRLKTFNKTGSVEYSNIIMLKQNRNRSDVLLSPNPARDYVNVTFYKQNAGQLVFSLRDITGKQLSSEKKMVAAGEQTVQLNFTKGLAKGNYILQLSDGETTTSHKLTVQ